MYATTTDFSLALCILLYTHTLQEGTKVSARDYTYIVSKLICNYTILIVIEKGERNITTGIKREIFQIFICAHSSSEKGNFYSFFGAQYSAYKNVKDYSQIKHKLKLKKKCLKGSAHRDRFANEYTEITAKINRTSF